MGSHERSLTFATTTVSTPMGAQRYDTEIASRVPRILTNTRFRHERFRSLRSTLDGDRRLPMAWLARASPSARAGFGKMTFPGKERLTHRTDLVLPPGAGLNSITIHDTVAWRFGDESAPVRAAAHEARRADAVICVSEFTAADVSEFLGVTNPIVIPNGVDARFFDPAALDETAKAAHGIFGQYVLHVGGSSSRKNLESLAAAWPRVHMLHPHVTLALAGPPHPRRTALFSGLAGTRLLGRMPDELMPSLLAGADALVVPSLYEGFGLPVLEAMAAGTLVVAADTSALHEVTVGAGVLTSPDAEGLAAGLLHALEDTSERDILIERAKRRASEFTWERTAEAHARVWLSLL